MSISPVMEIKMLAQSPIVRAEDVIWALSKILLSYSQLLCYFLSLCLVGYLVKSIFQRLSQVQTALWSFFWQHSPPNTNDIFFNALLIPTPNLYSTLIPPAFCICKFTYLLNFNLQINDCGTPMAICRRELSGEICESPIWEYVLPGEVKWGNALPSCFSSHIVNNPFCSLFMASVFNIFVLLTGDLAT